MFLILAETAQSVKYSAECLIWYNNKMAKAQTKYVCRQCGHESAKWLGKCPACDEWGTLEETLTALPSKAPGARTALPAFVGHNKPLRLGDVPSPAQEGRIQSGIGEFDRVLGGGIVRGALTLIGGDPGIGKCLAGSERVFDPLSGAYLPITEWAEQKRAVLALEKNTYRLIPAAATEFLAQGVRPIVEVTTRLGKTLRCTPSHPVLTPDGWRPVGDLPPGARLASPRALPFFGAAALDEEEVKLLAYILLDGSAQSSISVTSMLPEVEADLHHLADWFGMTLRIYPKPGNQAKELRLVICGKVREKERAKFREALVRRRDQKGVSWTALARQVGVPHSRLRKWYTGDCVPAPADLKRLAAALEVSIQELAADAVYSAPLVTPVARLLKHYGLRYSQAATKAVPEAVFCLPKTQIALFLKILFSCDGSVFLASKATPALSYSTISRRLAQDVQHLLLRFGFVARLRTKLSQVNGADHIAYELQLMGPEVKRFLAEIGIWGRAKAIEKIAALPAPRFASTQWDTIPVLPDFWQRLREAAGGASLSEISRVAGVKILDRRHDRLFCRQTVLALANAYPSSYLHRLVDSDIYWDEIRSIAPAGEEPVFDLTVPDGANFVASDLIVHNSTLLTQVAGYSAMRGGKTLYVSGEESATQIKLRAERLGITGGELLLHNETDVMQVAAAIQAERPAFAIIDSIQTMQHPDIESAAGSVSQVRAATAHLAQVAKGEGIPIFLVGHVTKEGTLAGPRVLEHMVDTVLTFEGDKNYMYRILRAVKNRFGSTDELGLFEMHEEGLVEVPNPSEMLLAERNQNSAGSAILATVEGTRPMLIEVQALVAPSFLANPRRTVSGVDQNRVSLILAVLEKRVGMGLASQDVFVNLAGGVRADEPAADLAVAVAAASSFQEKAVDPTTVFAGEVGLGGEVRAVGHVELRLREAARMGFKQAIICARNKAGLRRTPDLNVIGVDTVRQALDAALFRG